VANKKFTVKLSGEERTQLTELNSKGPAAAKTLRPPQHLPRQSELALYNRRRSHQTKNPLPRTLADSSH
jgi:hypothetical protein